MLRSLIPLPPFRRYDSKAFPADFLAAFAVLFLGVPQGLAFATIAGLPPVVGLYASTVPTIVAALFRSSSHVVSGPTNALSLLVGTAVAAGFGADPVEVVLTLALMVGVLQVGAGVLRLGSLVDFISSAVVLGYITGAGVLIGVGQLYNGTGTEGARGRIWVTVGGWVETLAQTQPVAVAVSMGTVALVIVVRILNRRLLRRLPSAIVAMVVALIVNIAFGLESRGLEVVSDLSPIPAGLPAFTLPDLSLAPELIGVAVACAVLSLVESSSVARSIAGRTGQKLDASTEFFGQGISNVAAAFFGGYPVSGSLSRSALNERAGAKTRLAGVMTGALMVVVLLAFGPILNHTPVASLAGLMFVVAYDLVDVPRIRAVMRTSWADAIAFLVTVIGTWTLSLDTAIYLGVGISLVLFLRRVRMVRAVELIPDANGHLQARPLGPIEGDRACGRVRVLNLEGSLFFGAAGELRGALTEAVRPDSVRVLVVRLKRAHGMDATTAMVFADLATSLRFSGRRLVLVGMSDEDMEVLEKSGAADAIGEDCLFPTREEWFSALKSSLQRAASLCGEGCDTCPLMQVEQHGPPIEPSPADG